MGKKSRSKILKSYAGVPATSDKHTLSVLLVFFLFFSTACSRLSMAVDWADNYLSFEIDSQFDFSSAQMRIIDPAIDQAVKDLKVKMFPSYADFLQNFGDQLLALESPSEIKPAAPVAEIGSAITEELRRKPIENIFANLRQRMLVLQKETIEVVKPLFQVVVSQVEEKNWQKFEKKFAERNEEIRKRDSQERGDAWIERIEDWTGNLNRDQEKIIMNWVETTPWPSELQIKNRNQLFSEFKKRLYKDEKFSPEVRAVIVETWIKNYELWEHPEYRPTTNDFYVKMNTMFAQLYLTLKSEQKAKLQKNISNMVAELRALAVK